LNFLFFEIIFLRLFFFYFLFFFYSLCEFSRHLGFYFRRNFYGWGNQDFLFIFRFIIYILLFTPFKLLDFQYLLVFLLFFLSILSLLRHFFDIRFLISSIFLCFYITKGWNKDQNCDDQSLDQIHRRL